ncbi:General transcription factor IIE subunit 1 [Ascosphaera aggregata]|nr:General transcription factor IIE subunit 1 [Ascosphaera aggregata]
MDLANSLIRMVARSFYEIRCILIIDSLFIHSVLNADDLSHLLSMQKKDLRKLCVKLRDDRMLAVHVRSEIRDGQTRPVNQEYYYIPLHPVVDAIKYRVSKLTSEVKAQFTPQVEKKEYICRRCRAEWTQLEVLGKVGPEGFVCDRCGHVLDRADELEGAILDRSGHEKNSKLMSQLDGILKLLKRIDSVQIPANDFDFAWEHRVEVIRDKDRNGPTKAPIVVTKKGAAVRGTSQTDATSVEVNLYSNAEKGAAELAETEKRKAELEKQNALPAWITTSAIAPESTTSGVVQTVSNGGDTQADVKTEVKQEIREQIIDESLDDKVAAYYAAMAEEEEAQRAKEEESEAGSSDDEDEFEDVGISGSATPADFNATISEAPSLKREYDEVDIKPSLEPSDPATAATEGQPALKKSRIESEANGAEGEREAERPTPARNDDALSDEEDEEEFEDV